MKRWIEIAPKKGNFNHDLVMYSTTYYPGQNPLIPFRL